MERFINVNGKIYSLKFGIKSLMILNEFSNNISEQELINLKFYLAIRHNDSLTIDDTNKILDILLKEKGPQYIEDLLKDFSDCHLDSLDIEELYRKAVGEMGIAPQIFYEMSPQELYLAYKGYLNRIELETNCILIAIRKSKDTEAELFSLIGGEGYRESTIAKRNETFNALGI